MTRMAFFFTMLLEYYLVTYHHHHYSNQKSFFRDLNFFSQVIVFVQCLKLLSWFNLWLKRFLFTPSYASWDPEHSIFKQSVWSTFQFQQTIIRHTISSCFKTLLLNWWLNNFRTSAISRTDDLLRLFSLYYWFFISRWFPFLLFFFVQMGAWVNRPFVISLQNFGNKILLGRNEEFLLYLEIILFKNKSRFI